MGYIDNKEQLRLSKVKSSHNIARRPFDFTSEDNNRETKYQSRALKQIWNERDEEIKRMNELFSKID